MLGDLVVAGVVVRLGVVLVVVSIESVKLRQKEPTDTRKKVEIPVYSLNTVRFIQNKVSGPVSHITSCH